MGDYDGHSSRGDSDLGLALTGHLWSASEGSLDTASTDQACVYIWAGQMLDRRQGGENQDGFVTGFKWTQGAGS